MGLSSAVGAEEGRNLAGTLRFFVDFRRLNALTIPDNYPLPQMEDCIDSLGKARLFTTLDALWGYWQVPIAERDRYKTTFTSHMGTFRYKRMPFCSIRTWT